MAQYVTLPAWLACPEHLCDPVERAAWEFYATKFYARGHLLPLHCSMLEILCSSYAVYRRACLDLEAASTVGEWRILRDIVRTSWKGFREVLAEFDLNLNNAVEEPIEVPPEGRATGSPTGEI